MSFPGSSDPAPRERFAPSDNLATPEAHEEVVRGRRVRLSPARVPHGDTHSTLDSIVRLGVADGYVASSDLLTRRSHDTDFATDACVRKAGTDPATGKRHLEELSFEIFHTQSRRAATRRARDVISSGVRRLIGVFVRARSVEDEEAGAFDVSVEEWLPDTGTWRVFGPEDDIHDPCLASPLPVATLLGALDLDTAAVSILVAKKAPAIEALEQSSERRGELRGELRGERRGEARATRRALLTVLEQRRLPLTTEMRARIDTCDDPETLDRWFRSALVADAAADLFD